MDADHPRSAAPSPMASPMSSPMLRRINAQTVLDALLDHVDGMNAADLMDATRLSRPTVHAVCDELITRGWLRELEPEAPVDASRPGRRARRYAPRPGAGNVVGLDMGATTVRAAVADLCGTVVGEASARFRHDRVPAGERLDVVRTTTARALGAAGVTPDTVLGAALGVPAPVCDGHAQAVESYLPGLAALDLREALAPLVGVPVLVDNDANLAVLAERHWGVAAGRADVVLVLAGERLGAGVCLDGRIVRGHRGGAGEMGFLDLVSGVGGTDAIGSLARRTGAGSAEELVAAVRRGDPGADAALTAVARPVARALAVLATLLDPELIVVGGAVAGSADVLLGPLRREFAQVTRVPVRLAASGLADRGVALGAVRAALDDVRPRLLDLATRA